MSDLDSQGRKLACVFSHEFSNRCTIFITVKCMIFSGTCCFNVCPAVDFIVIFIDI